MIEKINFYKLTNDKNIRGYSLDYNINYNFYIVNKINFLLCFNITQSFLPIHVIKLTNEEINYIKEIGDLSLFNNDKEAEIYLSRQLKINGLLNK